MGFLASKTVVYVTHQMEFLHSADHILVCTSIPSRSVVVLSVFQSSGLFCCFGKV